MSADPDRILIIWAEILARLRGGAQCGYGHCVLMHSTLTLKTLK